MSASTQHRLRKHPDYQRVYKSTRKQWARQIAFFAVLREPGSEAALRSDTPGPRIGLTVPKAMAPHAVERNRIKRRLRELVRAALPLLGGLPVDLVLHPKRGVAEADFRALEREIATLFRSVHARLGKPAPQSAPKPSAAPATASPAPEPSHAAG